MAALAGLALIKQYFLALFGAINDPSTTDVADYIRRISSKFLMLVKPAADALASTTTAHGATGGAWNVGTKLIKAIKLIPHGALTADDTDYATLTIGYNDGAGGAVTTIATITTKITGGSGDWTAGTAISLTLTTTAIADGKLLSYAIAKAASGVAVPPFTISVETEEV